MCVFCYKKALFTSIVCGPFYFKQHSRKSTVFPSRWTIYRCGLYINMQSSNRSPVLKDREMNPHVYVVSTQWIIKKKSNNMLFALNRKKCVLHQSMWYGKRLGVFRAIVSHKIMWKTIGCVQSNWSRAVSRNYLSLGNYLFQRWNARILSTLLICCHYACTVSHLFFFYMRKSRNSFHRGYGKSVFFLKLIE